MTDKPKWRYDDAEEVQSLLKYVATMLPVMKQYVDFDTDEIKEQLSIKRDLVTRYKNTGVPDVVGEMLNDLINQEVYRPLNKLKDSDTQTGPATKEGIVKGMLDILNKDYKAVYESIRTPSHRLIYPSTNKTLDEEDKQWLKDYSESKVAIRYGNIGKEEDKKKRAEKKRLVDEDENSHIKRKIRVEDAKGKVVKFKALLYDAEELFKTAKTAEDKDKAASRCGNVKASLNEAQVLVKQRKKELKEIK